MESDTIIDANEDCNKERKYLIEAKNKGLFHFNKYGEYVISETDAFKIFRELWDMKKKELLQKTN